MAENLVVDTGFIVALLSSRDKHHGWAVTEATQHPPPWRTCESVASEAFHLLGKPGLTALTELLNRRAVLIHFDLREEMEPVLKLLRKYSNVPMGLADACLVRMTETVSNAVVLTTDSDFRIYRRHSRQVIPCVIPS